MITHPALQLTGEPKRVLIVGGGDGGAARECLRYDSLEEVVVAEIDEMVVDVSKSSYRLSRLVLEISERLSRLAMALNIKPRQRRAHLMLIVDSTDPVVQPRGSFLTISTGTTSLA